MHHFTSKNPIVGLLCIWCGIHTLFIHWNVDMFILKKLPSLTAQQFVKMSPFSAASDENSVTMTTFFFQCSKSHSSTFITLKLWQNGCKYTYHIFKYSFLNENFCIRISFAQHRQTNMLSDNGLVYNSSILEQANQIKMMGTHCHF